MMDAKQLKSGLRSTAFALRGYNVTNLGRSREFLTHNVFGPIVREHLAKASQTCSQITGRKTDLVARVRRGRETTLKTYTDAIGLIVAMEMAQVQLLKQFFDIDIAAAKVTFGYSLGELSALMAAGVLDMQEGLKVPLALADDCVALSDGVTMGILFSRGVEISHREVRHLCQRINNEGRGVIDISSVLTPNSMLLLGQGDTLDRFRRRMRDEIAPNVHLRKNNRRWPPIHTSIVWEKNISNRAAVLLHTMQGGFTAPRPPVFSLITGTIAYDQFNVRDLLCRWVDSPQLLWEAIYYTLYSGVTTVVHVGPEPNIIPATYKRLKENVEAQTKNSFGMRALSIARPWLKAILPARTALLRAPEIKHVMLEDWLLEQKL